jgi:iron complex outermembrane receptor protein
MFTRNRVAAAASLLSALVASTPAFAQLEEIVVTAQRREQSLQEVPITISAMTGEQFDTYGVTRASDLDRVFANLSQNRNSAAISGFAIRGVGTDNVHLSGQQSVGTYIDDVSTVSPFIGAIGVFDIDRVEVLRGPQNTLYGRNTTGGAIVWHTNQATPGEGTNGYGRLRMGDGGLTRFEGAVGFDINEQFAARVAVMTDEFDGQWTNVLDGGDTGGAYDRNGIRANLVWDNDRDTRVGLTLSTGASDGEDVGYKASGNRLANGTFDPNRFERSADDYGDQGPDNFYVRATAANVASFPYLQDQYDRGTGMVIDNPDPTAGAFNRLLNYSTEPGFAYQDREDDFETSWDQIRLNIDHSFENMDFSSITSYDETYANERNGGELTGFSPAREGDWRFWQQEFRLTSTTDGPIQWLTGFYLTDSESEEDTWVANVGGAGGMGVGPGIDIDSTYEAWSIYGQADWQVTDALTLTAGLRHTDDKLSADGENWRRTVCGWAPSDTGQSAWTRDFRTAGCPGLTPGRVTGNTDSPVQELSELGWKVGANYLLGDSAMIFASASHGFKGGAYDNRALSTGDDPISPEFLTAFEVGYKGDFLDDTLQINLAAYIYDWEDLQLFESYGGIPALVNVPGIDISGVEVEFKWAPSERWYFQGGLGTTDTEVVDVTGLNPASAAEVGKEVTNSPELTYNVLGTYTIPLGNGELSLMANYRYESEFYFSFVQNEGGYDESNAHGYLNARAGYSFGQDQQYELSLWGNNLTEEFACGGVGYGAGAGGNLNFGCNIKSFGVAQYGLTFEARFGNN